MDVRMLGTSQVSGIEQVIHVNLQRGGKFLERGGGASLAPRFYVDDLDAVDT